MDSALKEGEKERGEVIQGEKAEELVGIDSHRKAPEYEFSTSILKNISVC